LIGDSVTAVPGDTTSTADLDRLFQTVRAEAGKLDILVANSGRVEPEEFGKVTEGNFDKTFDLNARAAPVHRAEALPLMSDGGSIILVGSIAGYKGPQRLHHLQRNQGPRCAPTPAPGPRSSRTAHPHQHPEPRADRHPDHGRPSRHQGRRRRHPRRVRLGHPARANGSTRGSRRRRLLPGLRREPASWPASTWPSTAAWPRSRSIWKDFIMSNSVIGLSIDCADAATLAQFWADVLGRPVRPPAHCRVRRDRRERVDAGAAAGVPPGPRGQDGQEPAAPGPDQQRLRRRIRPTAVLGATHVTDVESGGARWTTVRDPRGQRVRPGRRMTPTTRPSRPSSTSQPQPAGTRPGGPL